jgi:peptidoglycan/LPS O-acetylase OafA/YrhL
MTTSSRHVAALDGLRGLGALCVLCTHYALHLFQDATGYPAVTRTMNAIDHTPVVHVIFAGYPWVNMFFVLSGFALSAMVSGPGTTPRAYLPYAINRVLRIYPAYFFAVLSAFVLQHFLYRGPIADFGDWFNSCWTAPPTRKDVIDHAIMIGQFKTDRFVFVIWSLVQEMRISFLFPLIYAVIARLGVRRNLHVGVALIALDFAWSTLADHDYLTPNTYYFTLHYTIFFWAGSLIFKYREAIKQWWAERTDGQIAVLGAAGFIVFNYASNLDAVLTPDAMRTVVVSDWLGGAGAVVFILFALYSAPISRLLSTRIMRFFGTISYSLYLAHAIVLLAAFHALYGAVPLAILLPACAVASFAISYVSFTVIERPFMIFGKRVAAVVAKRL